MGRSNFALRIQPFTRELFEAVADLTSASATSSLPASHSGNTAAHLSGPWLYVMVN
jgi:hypothetical protein